ncbi:transcription initiation protein SPT3 homolog [Aphidius gifuensis]|uniref:transcription initiation protein SPT3 homolog n=1 Tax=Aphidius gifuensis TaxID=684658 RepID=UPI001CDB5610|nr:transcription initiation protein SPT3 homolog [Aphidius gifuensis]
MDECRSDSSNYITEIKRMMHGFGDSSQPLTESATMINDVVQRQIKAFVYEASKIADNRQSNTVEDEDFLFLLRRDKIKLQRLLKYLQLKEFKSTMNKVLDSDSLGVIGEETQEEKIEKRYKKLFNNLVSIDDSTTIDDIKYNRDLRAEMLSRTLNTSHYIEYAKARSASFANKYNIKFANWINPDGDMKISKQSYTILNYLCYETVAQIMDLAFLVRQDQSKIYGDALDTVRLGYCNPSTYKPYQHGKNPVFKPITPSEISEAIRRYWSPQLNYTGPFHRWSLNRQHPKFLVI